MKIQRNISLLSFLVLTNIVGIPHAFAQGGSNAGNGGDVVDCPGRDLQMLDVIEASDRKIVLRDPGIDRMSGGRTVRAYVEHYLGILEKKDKRGADYLAIAQPLLKDIEDQQEKDDPEYLGSQISFTKRDLQDVDDSKEVITEPGCVKKQLIVQKEPEYSEDRLFKIDSKLWTRLSNWQKSLAVLHELFLKETIRVGHSNSRAARYLMTFATQHNFENVSTCDWVDRIQKAGLWSYTYGGITMARSEYDFKSEFLRSSRVHSVTGEVSKRILSDSFIQTKCDSRGILLEAVPNVAATYLNNIWFASYNERITFDEVTGTIKEIFGATIQVRAPGHERKPEWKRPLYTRTGEVRVNSDGILTLLNTQVIRYKTNFRIANGGVNGQFLEQDYLLERVVPLIEVDKEGRIHER